MSEEKTLEKNLRNVYKELEKENKEFFISSIFSKQYDVDKLVDYFSYALSEKYNLPKIEKQKVRRDPEARLVKMEQSITDLKRKYEETVSELKEIKGLLWKRESKKDSAIIKFKELATKIDNVYAIYCKMNPDGVSFLTLIDPSDLSDTLRKIVSIQIDMENIYEDIFFEFLVENIESKKTDPTGWSPLLIR